MLKKVHISVIAAVGALSLLTPALRSQTVSATQQKSTSQRVEEQTRTPQVVLDIESPIHVANLYAAILSTPAVCGPNGRLYANVFLVRPTAPEGATLSQTIIGVDRNGNSDLTIAPEQITDVKDPHIISFFVAEDALYLLVRGPKDSSVGPSEPHKGDLESLFQKSDSEREFIARFGLDGTYRGAIHIDVPVSGLQIGVFRTGQFVIAGVDSFNEARVVLLKPSGVFDRYIETRKLDNEESSAPNTPESSLGSRLFVAGLSRLVLDGPDILLISPEAPSVIKIHNSGIAEEIRLKNGVSGIDSFQAVSEGWLVQFRGNGAQEGKPKQDMATLLYARTDGHPIRKYTLEHADDLTLGCKYDREITFLKRDTDGKLLLLVTSPASKRNVAPTPGAQ